MELSRKQLQQLDRIQNLLANLCEQFGTCSTKFYADGRVEFTEQSGQVTVLTYEQIEAARELR